MLNDELNHFIGQNYQYFLNYENISQIFFKIFDDYPISSFV